MKFFEREREMVKGVIVNFGRKEEFVKRGRERVERVVKVVSWEMEGSEGRREMIELFLKGYPKIERSKGGRKVVEVLIERIAKIKESEGRGEICNWLVETRKD